jgi:hypothetical protein
MFVNQQRILDIMSSVATRPVTCTVSPKDKEFIRRKIIQAMLPLGFCAVELPLASEKQDDDYDADMDEFLSGIVPGPKKKKFRFADEDGGELEKVKFFDAPRSENICPKFHLPSVIGEVPPYLQTGGSQWCDDELDRKIYQINKRMNRIDPSVQDDVALAICKQEGIMKKSEIKDSRVRNWHLMGPDPIRFLVGHILTVPSARQDIAKLSPQVQERVKKMLSQMIEDLETGKKKNICFYEAGSKAGAKHVRLLKGRLAMFP